MSSSSAKNLVIGDLVWAKMKGYPWWPGQIKMGDKPRPGVHHIYFFGTHNSANTKYSCIKEYAEHAEELENLKSKRVPKGFDVAVAEIKHAYNDKLEYEKELRAGEDEEEDETEDDIDDDMEVDETPKTKIRKRKPTPKKNPRSEAKKAKVASRASQKAKVKKDGVVESENEEDLEAAMEEDVEEEEVEQEAKGSQIDQDEDVEEQEVADEIYVPRKSKKRSRAALDDDDDDDAEEKPAKKIKTKEEKAEEKRLKREEKEKEKEERRAEKERAKQEKQQQKHDKQVKKEKEKQTTREKKDKKKDPKEARREHIEKLKALKMEEKKAKKRQERREQQFNNGTPAQRLEILVERLGEAFSKDGKRDVAEALIVVEALDKIDMTIQLLTTTMVGKMVKKISKAGNYPQLAKECRALVSKWQHIVQVAQNDNKSKEKPVTETTGTPMDKESKITDACTAETKEKSVAETAVSANGDSELRDRKAVVDIGDEKTNTAKEDLPGATEPHTEDESAVGSAMKIDAQNDTNAKPVDTADTANAQSTASTTEIEEVVLSTEAQTDGESAQVSNSATESDVPQPQSEVGTVAQESKVAAAPSKPKSHALEAATANEQVTGETSEGPSNANEANNTEKEHNVQAEAAAVPAEAAAPAITSAMEATMNATAPEDGKTDLQAFDAPVTNA